MNTMPFFFNHCIDKGRLKRMILWSLTYQGEHKTLQLIENLKTLGFKYATYAGVSLSIDDLSIPPKKKVAVLEAEGFVAEGVQGTLRGDRSVIEGLQSVIDTWHRTSENVKDHVIDYFEATNILNPVYMMAFSGARGNVSQVRQLVGMRGLMADPNGNIIGYPIRSNFREGLTVTEYMISCYGARKGVVDTALRTADAGYLTRRLVDVAQHVVVQKGSCGTRRGITIASLYDGRKKVISLADRLLGRVLAADIVEDRKVLGVRNQAISESFALRLSQLSEQADPRAPLTITVRSPLTCDLPRGVCQLCYGWSLAQSSLVTLGEAVGVIAGQSIGEPGTQLTMRTFHTGGVFTGDVQDEFRSPHAGVVHFPEPLHGLLVRTSYGQISFLVKMAGTLLLMDNQRRRQTRIHIPVHTALFAREGEFVHSNQLLGQFGDLDNQQNERVKTRKIVASLRDGEVFLQQGSDSQGGLSVKALQKSYSEPKALGTLWVLAGKYLTQNRRLLPLFKTSGHIVEAESVLSRMSILSNIEGFITHQPMGGPEGRAPQDYRLFPPTPIEGLQQPGAFPSGPKAHGLRLPVFGATRTLSTPYSHVLGRRLFSNGSKETFVLLNARGSLAHYGRPSSKPSSLQGLNLQKSKAFTPVSLFYFHDDFKTQSGGELWFDPSLVALKRFQGFLFWVPSLQKNNSRIKRNSGTQLQGWQQRRSRGITKPSTPQAVIRTRQGLRWVQKNEPLYTMHTVQGTQKTYNAAVSGLLQYETQETRKALGQRSTVQVASLPQLNPLAKNDSRFYKVTPVAARLTPSKSLAGQFPFPYSSVRCPLQTKLGIHPGWIFLPALTAFKRKTVSMRSAVSSPDLPHFDGDRVTFTPFLLNTARASQSTTPRAPDSPQTPRTRKLYSWVTKNTHCESLELPFLDRLRALACLRHPHLLKGTFLRTKEITEQVGVFSVFHYAQSPLYGLFAPTSLNGRTVRLSFSAFTGWVYSRLNVPSPRGFPQGLLHVKKYTAKNISSYHVKSTLILLYRPIQEYSLTRVIGIKNKLQWYQNFEQHGYMDLRDVSHRTRALLPLWSKQHQTVTRLDPPVKLFRVFSRMLPVKRYAPAPTFILRFVVDLGLAGAPPATPTVTCEAPWNAVTTYGLGWNLSFYQTGEASLLGPCHGMILAGQFGFVRQVPGVAEGEVYTRSDKKCILLRSGDRRSFQVPHSRTEGSPPYKVSVGQLVRYGDEICPGIASPESGQVIAIEGAHITLRKGQPVLFYKTGTVLHVKDKQWLDLGQPLVTLTYQRLVTGDIVQGIPKVEQVFEASSNRLIKGNLKQLLGSTFEAYKKRAPYALATRQSLDFIQKEIIERIQKIYLSQGVSISDKHFEIIVRQMTSTVKVVDPGETGLFSNEKVSLNRVENMNLTIRKEDKGQLGLPADGMAQYEPILVGISEMALNSNSFLSAASFQETTRILTRDSILRKTDFLRGLKERVILGDLIPAGTGLPEVIAYRTAPSEPGDFYWEPSPMEFTEIFSNLDDPAWEPIATEGLEDSPPSTREKVLALLLKKK